MKKEPVHKTLGKEYGLRYKERITDELWVKIYSDSPYEYLCIVDDDGNIHNESFCETIDNYELRVSEIKKDYAPLVGFVGHIKRKIHQGIRTDTFIDVDGNLTEEKLDYYDTLF